MTAIRNGKYVTCSISQFKKIGPDVVGPDDDTESEDNEKDDIPPQENPQPMCFQGIQFIQSVIDGNPSGPNIQSIIMVTIYTNSESVEQFICTC